jgi:RNA polymerase sigma factor (sigma-70 family)
VSSDRAIEHLLRPLAPQVLAALVRRYGQFDACEDAVQEALLAAAVQWARDGTPDNPRGWLIAVASRRLIDEWRSDEARRRREEDVHSSEQRDTRTANQRTDRDDTLALLFMCCHEALTPASQIALTLRAVGGLSTAEIASAFLVPEATMAQRISRAKQTIKASGIGFDQPPNVGRLPAVLHVVYLIFNEGYTASSGPHLQRTDLAEEAIRIARMLHRLLPEDGEVAGLLALMLLTHARRAARVDRDGALVPLAEQNRRLWDRAAIDEGVSLITRSLRSSTLGPYQLQAAIAAVHDEAPTAADTDWAQILSLYVLLERLAPNPMVTLNRAVAVAMAQGPRHGLELLASVQDDPRIRGAHRFHAVRAHLLELAGDRDAARDAYRLAARMTTSQPESDYLLGRAARA